VKLINYRSQVMDQVEASILDQAQDKVKDRVYYYILSQVVDEAFNQWILAIESIENEVWIQVEGGVL